MTFLEKKVCATLTDKPVETELGDSLSLRPSALTTEIAEGEDRGSEESLLKKIDLW